MDNIKNDSTVSEAAIANRVGLSESGIQYHIKKMKVNGEIERLGADLGGQWKVNVL